MCWETASVDSMLSTILANHPWLTAVGMLGVIIVGLALAYWLVRSSRTRLAWLLTAVALLGVLALTLYPDGATSSGGCIVDQSFSFIGGVESAANVILFVPVVLLAGIASRRPCVALVGGSVLSALVELVQAAAPALGRSCTANDWLENTLGAVVGTVLAAVAIAVAKRRSRSR